MIPQPSRRTAFTFVFLSGIAALSWEVLWQLKATLALGISAWGTAITLAVMMGGLSFGSMILGRILHRSTRRAINPFFVYAVLEIIIGLCGLFLNPAFAALEHLDTTYYRADPTSAPLIYAAGIAAIIGLPALAMGATLPVLGLMTRHPSFSSEKRSIAHLYGMNTLGAAVGSLLAAFVFIPFFGVSNTVFAIAGINFLTALSMPILFGKFSTIPGDNPPESEQPKTGESSPKTIVQIAVVSLSGLATFMLEIAWFRSLTAAFMSTTEAFAIMLSSVLIALGAASYCVPLLKKYNRLSLGGIALTAACLIFLTTPVVERFDLFSFTGASHSSIVFLQWFALSLYIIGGTMFFIGLLLPWILDSHASSSRRLGTLYGLNAVFAILGSLSAAWIFLPTIGLAKTAWIAAFLLVILGFFIIRVENALRKSAIVLLCFAVAYFGESGIGQMRVQGTARTADSNVTARIVAAKNGPDSTVSVVEMHDGGRALFIDGFETTMQLGEKDKNTHHYMPWMGHLPMLAHPAPQSALVICFGTGQTANALREENPDHLEIVDINKNVIGMADYFAANKGVLKDPRTHVTIMDGRAFMRRTNQEFDVITLEPMPPNFAGVNALYSREFYLTAKEQMTAQGMIAQWVPFHLLTPRFTKAIAATFLNVFPNAVLWVDPPSGTGILLGSKDASFPLGAKWAGFARGKAEGRDMTEKEVTRSVIYDREALTSYAKDAPVITDDNQLLSYGEGAHILRTDIHVKNGRLENHLFFTKLLNEKKKAETK